MKMKSSIILLTIVCVALQSASCQQHQAQQRQASFPGVSRDLSAFCAARPSLPIDLASMVVHVKKNVSFNYKLYLFSGEHVFQTGQVIPRDDFRIHSFPVALKRINEFWPESVPTYQLDHKPPTAGKESDVSFSHSRLESIQRVPSSHFNLGQFLKHVPLNPPRTQDSIKAKAKTWTRKSLRQQQTPSSKRSRERRLSSGLPPDDAHGDALPGDPIVTTTTESSFISHDVARVLEARSSAAITASQAAAGAALDEAERLEAEDDQSEFDANTNIEFDSDDEVAAHPLAHKRSAATHSDQTTNAKSNEFSGGDMIVPVGAFSSFHVNLTYLVRKDFGQVEPNLIRIQVDSSKFLVTQVLLISNSTNNQFNSSTSFYSQSEDFRFLAHKLLRDPNTRITSINQIYEDWISRNFYTIVYVQRRLADDEINHYSKSKDEHTIVNDRLVFRGTSMALLGADQLDYSVKAAAFITEKNGLHYYLEFLTTSKFYVCAVDWSKRPFKIFDSRQFPFKATKTQLDNEELLLCPPAVCYSNQPVDEIIGYGRMILSDGIQQQAHVLSSSAGRQGSNIKLKLATTVNSNEHEVLPASNKSAMVYGTMSSNSSHNNKRRLKERQANGDGGGDNFNVYNVDEDNSNEISFNSVIEALKIGSRQLQTRLHLRDWVWILPRQAEENSTTSLLPNQRGAINSSLPSFEWQYELARRNDIKAKPDSYGYVLTGHEIDASYRVYNELYLISANHLITINYTMPNETVISTHSIGDEFSGLSSTIIDPITGAFYDRYANELYFFKGDRYVGYDYASKKPLDEFLIQVPANTGGGSTDDYLSLDPKLGFETGAKPIVSSLPVVGILGRQHQVDGVYHDFLTDLVYIFSGMKFYTFEAKEFKNGALKPESRNLPRMHCINEHFLNGCHFDRAFPNPCREEEEDLEENSDKSAKLSAFDGDGDEEGGQVRNATLKSKSSKEKNKQDQSDFNFSEEQQMRLRSIAVKPLGLLNLLVENTILRNDAAKTIVATSANFDSQPRAEKVIYLLLAMIAFTILVTIVMIAVLINWTRVKLMSPERHPQEQQQQQQQPGQHGDDGELGGAGVGGFKVERVSRNHYLANQQQHHSRRHPYLHSSYQIGRDTSPATFATDVGSSRAQSPAAGSMQKAIVSVAGAGRSKQQMASNNNIDNSAL